MNAVSARCLIMFYIYLVPIECMHRWYMRLKNFLSRFLMHVEKYQGKITHDSISTDMEITVRISLLLRHYFLTLQFARRVFWLDCIHLLLATLVVVGRMLAEKYHQNNEVLFHEFPF